MAVEDSVERANAPEHPDEHLVVGRVIRPHGVRGMLLVEPFTEVIHSIRPSSEIFLGPDRVPVVVRAFRPHRARFLLSIEECDDRLAADGWRGLDIFLSIDDAEPLPEGVFYHWQILGLEVVTEEGELLGKVDQILETGANDVYMVRDEAGGELLIPAIESVILQTNLPQGQILVRLIPGLRTSDKG